MEVARQLSVPIAAGASLGGNPPEVVDAFAWSVLAVICGISLLAYGWQEAQVRLMKMAPSLNRNGEQRTPVWVFISFVFCYGILIPGLFCTLFSYDISAVNGSIKLKSATETMVGFVAHLWETHAQLGAMFVVLYAIVIPVVKLILFVLSEVWRRGGSRQVLRARRCVQVLQYISKWASPDMFAYVLLLYLLRGLNHPTLLIAVAELDIGFTCFSVFCVCSTVAALGLKVPPLPEGRQAPTSCFCGCTRRPALLAALVTLLCAAFVPLLVTGLAWPSMSLSIDLDPMFEPPDGLDPALKPFVEALGIQQLAHADVSVWRCMGKFAEWTATGEANAFIGFMLFAVFVCLTTCLNMLVLLISAWTMWYQATWPSAETSEAAAPPRRDQSAFSNGAVPLRMTKVAKVLKKLSFLDVAIVGIVVVVLGGVAYRKMGLVIELQWGLLPLAAAELCHYFAYYLVVYTALPAPPAAAERSKDAEAAKDEEAGEELEVEPLPTLLQARAASSAEPCAGPEVKGKASAPEWPQVLAAASPVAQELPDAEARASNPSLSSGTGSESALQHSVRFWDEMPGRISASRQGSNRDATGCVAGGGDNVEV